jgi:hypothetical protein
MISKAHPSIHGGEVTRQASGWRRQLTRTSCQREGWKTGTAATFSDEVGAPVAGGILRRGGEEEEAQVQVYPEKKVARRCSGLCSPWRGSRRRRLSDNDGGALGPGSGGSAARTRKTAAQAMGRHGGAEVEARMRAWQRHCARTTEAGRNGCGAVRTAPLRHGRDGSAAPGSQSGRGVWRLSR